MMTNGESVGFIPYPLQQIQSGRVTLQQERLAQTGQVDFLTWINMWNDDGFKPVHDSWLFRAENRDQEITLTHGAETVTGTFSGLDDSGNLLLKGSDGTMRALYLKDIFERPASGGTE